MGTTFWTRLGKAWKTLWNEEADIQVITEDMKTFALLKEKTSQFEQNAVLKSLERLERTMNLLLSRMNDINEKQQATTEVLVAFSTASEEISHGFEVLAETLIKPAETKKAVSKSSIDPFARYADTNHGRKKSN